MHKEYKINDQIIWITLEPIRFYNESGLIEETGNYLCYWKTSEPTPFILGELLRDVNGKPLCLKDIIEAETLIKRKFS